MKFNFNIFHSTDAKLASVATKEALASPRSAVCSFILHIFAIYCKETNCNSNILIFETVFDVWHTKYIPDD